MAAVRLACEIAAHDLHRPEGPASDRRGDPRNRRPLAGRRCGGAVRRGHLERRHSRAAVPLLAGRRGPSRARQRNASYHASPCSRCRWPMSALAGCRWAGACASAWRGTATPIWSRICFIAVVGSRRCHGELGRGHAYDMSADRKAIAREAEKSVRRMTAAALRTAPPAAEAPAGEPPLASRNRPDLHGRHGAPRLAALGRAGHNTIPSRAPSPQD